MRKLRTLLVPAVLLAAGLFWWTLPAPLPARATEGLAGDAGRGERVFWAAGCASCQTPSSRTRERRAIWAGTNPTG